MTSAASDHGRDAIVRRERVISTSINAIVPAGIIWALDLPPPATLLGAEGIVVPLTQAAVLATFLMTLVLTLVIRARIRAGALAAYAWPAGPIGRLPRVLVLRAAVLAGIAWVVLVPAGVVAVAALDLLPMTRSSMFGVNLGFGAVIGFVMTRAIVLSALADGARQ